MIGEIVGSYQIAALLSVGGMGSVYTATHSLIGRPAAVKMLLPEFSQNRDIVNRFFNEAKATAAIRHPGIVEIFDFGYHASGQAFLVMELLHGEPLSSRLARERPAPLSEEISIVLVRSIVGALAALMGGGSGAAGDPGKVAQVVLQVAAMEEPPVRLLVGSDAVSYAAAAAQARANADAAWKELSPSTDHDDVDDAAIDPLGTASSPSHADPA